MSKYIFRSDEMFKKKQDSTKEQLLKEINEAAHALETARQKFDNADEDMLEACIYEMNAARARYGSLVREYKGQGGD